MEYKVSSAERYSFGTKTFFINSLNITESACCSKLITFPKLLITFPRISNVNFVPTPPASTHHLVQKPATCHIQTIKKQFHFRNQPVTSTNIPLASLLNQTAPTLHCSSNRPKTTSLTFPNTSLDLISAQNKDPPLKI